MATFQVKYDGKGCEREKIKIFIPFRSYPTPNVKTPKQIAKKLKKYHYGFISSQNRLEKPEKE